MTTIILNFENIPCGSCAKTITKAIQDLPGIHACDVDARNNQATIQFMPERIQVQTIQNALSKAGYKTELPDNNIVPIPLSK